MGTIRKQSAYSSVFIFIGFAIGALNILVLFPKLLVHNEFAITRGMVEISLTLATFCTLGSLNVIYKFYPFYHSYLKQKDNDLPFVTGLICLIGYLFVVIAGIVFRDFIVRKLGKSPEFAPYFYTVYPFTFFLLLFTWLEAFGWSVRKTILTNFLRETAVRLLTTGLILLCAFQLISSREFINLYSLSYLPSALILYLVLVKSGRWKFSFVRLSAVTRRLKKRMISFGLFVFGAQFLNILVKTNDTILILGLQGLGDLPVFVIANYLVTVMELPQRSLHAISVPVLAEAWKNNDRVRIDSVYRKSVSTLLVIALGMFGLIFLNSYSLVEFLGKQYAMVPLLVFIMGIAKVIDLGTGVNTLVIGTSNYWKFDFYTNVIYTLLSIPLNVVLIKWLQLAGLAYSMLISLTIYNTVRHVFIYRTFGFQPYTVTCLLAVIISGIIYLIVYLVPHHSNIFIDVPLRSLLFSGLFLPSMYFLKIVPDINELVHTRVSRVIRLVRK
ncbi:MAG: polysaccharide biosynthesis C-terminal domain-containing protein [Williamsia sp.]|nr:polysaccharide biosynthesis C-terminal domain-containing protein [Williamsia sp.]